MNAPRPTSSLAFLLAPLAALSAIAALGSAAGAAPAVPTFAGNPQHTAVYEPPAQNLNAIRWSTSIDASPGTLTHYGAPLVTTANTLVAPVKTAGGGFRLDAFDAAAGTLKYSLSTDYILPSHQWIPVYQPALATSAAGTRLYYPGAGGTVYSITNPDSAGHGAPVQQVFYTSLANYQANAAAFNAAVFINTPITPDAQGNVFFGFRVQGTAPAPLSTTRSGFARIDPNGNATYVLVNAAANDANIDSDSHNSAPALSNDETTVYVVARSSAQNYGYLLGLDATTLATRFRVRLKDPRNNHLNDARISDNSTASPLVAPDGDVYFGILGNPTNGSRGFLLHFRDDLALEKTPGAFGWDNTAAIVPAAMVPSYVGPSSYLIFTKYNDYANAGGDGGQGVNRIALLDPGATQVEAHSGSNGLLVMREVLIAIGPTADAEIRGSFPDAVREWCINTAAVNPATQSIFAPNEDGRLYRWDLASNSLSQAVRLTAGIGEPYVPTVIGPDGTVFTENGGTLFAVGALPGVGITVVSSAPDARGGVPGQSLTFTATVTNTGPPGNLPTGTVTFEDTVYFVTGGSLSSTTTVLASVPLDGAGQASVTTSALSADNHFVTARYSGDSHFAAGSATLVQTVHAGATATTLNAIPSPSRPVVADLIATVAAVPPASATPTGMVTFLDGGQVLAQLAVDGSGTASFLTGTLADGSHTFTAVYASDSHFAASSGSTTLTVAPPPNRFRTVLPCRIADTRDATGPWGGPALTGDAPRTFALAGRCGIPGTARAVSLNLTIVAPAADGTLRAYAAGTAEPPTSALNFRAGQVRANNAVLPVSQDGNAALTVRPEIGGGPVHLVIDVNGYFGP